MKRLMILLSMFLVIGVLAACGDEGENEEQLTNENNQENNQAGDNNLNENDLDEESDDNLVDEESGGEKINMKEKEEELVPLAIDVINAYAHALETGDKETFHALIDKHVADVDTDEILIGRKHSKDNFDNVVDNSIEINGDHMTEYAADLSKVSEDSLVLDTSNSTSTSAIFIYEYDLENFYGSVVVVFTFYKIDNGEFVLEKIDVL